MTNKKCCICKQILDLACFKSNKTKKDGLQAQCIECQKEYRKKHYISNRKKYIDKASVRNKTFQLWFRKFKTTLKCNRCEENHPSCLQFHHTSNDKEECVSRLVAKGCMSKILTEIQKCEVLCANCHFKEHWKE